MMAQRMRVGGGLARTQALAAPRGLTAVAKPCLVAPLRCAARPAAAPRTALRTNVSVRASAATPAAPAPLGERGAMREGRGGGGGQRRGRAHPRAAAPASPLVAGVLAAECPRSTPTPAACMHACLPARAHSLPAREGWGAAAPGRTRATPPSARLRIPALRRHPPPASLPLPSPPHTHSRAAPGGGGGIKWGADLKKLAICVGIGTALWFVPPPAGVTLPAWHLLAIFLSTIAGIITTPLPLGAVAMLGLGACMMTKTLTFAAAFSAFANEIPWLIAIAFWLSGGFIRSGLGARIAYSIVALFGKTTLGLTYSLVAAEALLAPAIPSVAARAGGLFLPLAKALCLACGERWWWLGGWLGGWGWVMRACVGVCEGQAGRWLTAPAPHTHTHPPTHPPPHIHPTPTPRL